MRGLRPMKRNHLRLIALLTASLAIPGAAFAQTSRFDELANLPFAEGRPTKETAQKRRDAKTLVTTPNSDVLYAMSYVDLSKDGPLVMEAPPNLQGILLDYWQRPIPVDGGKFFGDVGLFGPDAGKGGKFLMLP